MNIKRVDATNIDSEHICCAISDKKGETCVASKKAWMQERFEEGLIFEKLDVRGKVFIEYLPSEVAWAPIEADNCFYINCLWVSGQFKGQGYADQLLKSCMETATKQGKAGLIALASPKKKPFLSDPDYLKQKGFVVVDQAEPYFDLMFLPLKTGVQPPKFKAHAKTGRCEGTGLVLYYTNQCPHTEKYAPLIAQMAEAKGLPFQLIKLADREAAQAAPSPFTTYSLYYNGVFVTNEVLSEKRFEKVIESLGL